MAKKLCALLLLALVSSACNSVVTIEAQSLPVSKTVAWNANAASDSVTSYSVSLDSNVVNANVAPSASPSQQIILSTTGLHTILVTATNMWGTSAPATLQVNVVVPATPTNMVIK